MKVLYLFQLKQILHFLCIGYVGGSHYSHIRAAVDPLCLPRNQEWGTTGMGQMEIKLISTEQNRNG